MLGDYYRAEPPVRCPVCAEPIYEWVGFVGPGAWLVFIEGKLAPETERVPESVRAKQPGLEHARLPDGEHSIYGTCLGGHHLLAHIEVRHGRWDGLRITDAEGHEGTPLRGPWRLWWTLGRLVSIARDRPAESDDVVPATVSALGLNDQCILATRRAPRRDKAHAEDEWWIVDLARGRAHGPIPDAELQRRFTDLGLTEPEHLTLPEDLGDR